MDDDFRQFDKRNSVNKSTQSLSDAALVTKRHIQYFSYRPMDDSDTHESMQYELITTFLRHIA